MVVDVDKLLRNKIILKPRFLTIDNNALFLTELFYLVDLLLELVASVDVLKLVVSVVVTVLSKIK